MNPKPPDKPLVSIVTPSYNQGRFIEDTILSVKNQDYPNIEHIIVDGGSTDNTLEILRKYEGTYNMRWISEPDGGQANAVNKGLQMAQGEWLGWQNSDDYYLPGAFWSFLRATQSVPGSHVYYANKLAVDVSGRILKKQFYTRPSLFLFRFSGMTMCNQACFIHKSVFDTVCGLDESLDFAMDHELFLRMLFNGVAMQHVRRFWGVSRYHPASKSCGQNQDAWVAERRAVYKKYGLRWRGDGLRLANLTALGVRTCYQLADNGMAWVVEKLSRMSPQRRSLLKLTREQVYPVRRRRG